MILRDYQDQAVTSLFTYFGSHSGNPIVAMPTGTGKSLVIGDFCRRTFHQWPHQRFMMLTHVKELIEQNAEELLKLWPTAPLGIYSAGLKQKDIILPIVFGGIASVNKHPQIFGHRDIVIIDECHLLGPNDDTMYQNTLKVLKQINPHLKVVGLSATPWRLKQGMLTDGGLFTDFCFDITDVASFNRLIAEGYLCQLIPKPTATTIDISNVGMSAGDLNSKQLEAAVDKDEITYAAVKEMVEQGQDRNSWLVFAAGIANSEHIASMLQSFGVSAAASHSKLSDEENKQRIRDFKSGHLRALVNNNKYTTGFNHPAIDMIGMLRPTISPGLWVQMLGRGTRPSPDTGKLNCLVLDFAGNTARLGPINDPMKPQRPGKARGDVPVKICPACNAYNHTMVKNCINCGYEFEFETKIFKTAAELELIKSDAPVIEIFEVKRVIYNLHEKRNADGVLLSPPSMKVSYFCGFQMFSEWVCLEHPGMASKRARDWWRQRHREDPPPTTFEALRRQSELRVPARIRVWINKKYPEVLGYEY